MPERGLAELALMIERSTRVDGTHETAIPELTLYRASAPSAPTPLLYEPALCLIAQGRKRVILAGEAYHYDPSQLLLVAADLPVAGQIVEASRRSPYLGLRVTLDPAILAELIAQDRPPATPRAQPERALAVSPVPAPLLDAVVRLLALLDDAHDRSVLAPLVLREITYRLLAGDQGQRLRQVVAVNGQGRRIASSLRFIREHFSEPLRIEVLARKAGMSPSALHQHFKSVTAMSPLQYQKRLRLHEARRLMLGEGLDAAEACFRVGYESPSQFSREYRRQFGAPPRRDVSALRREPLLQG